MFSGFFKKAASGTPPPVTAARQAGESIYPARFECATDPRGTIAAPSTDNKPAGADFERAFKPFHVKADVVVAPVIQKVDVRKGRASTNDVAVNSKPDMTARGESCSLSSPPTDAD